MEVRIDKLYENGQMALWKNAMFYGEMSKEKNIAADLLDPVRASSQTSPSVVTNKTDFENFDDAIDG